MRPVFYDYPEAASALCDQSMTFTLGRALLVAPPPKPESPQSYAICLPSGGWYDYWTGKPVVAPVARTAQALQSPEQTVGGNRHDGEVVNETPRLDRLPVFVRAGTILPRQPLTQSMTEVPKGPLQLDLYPGQDCVGEIYADDGLSLGYRRGVYFRQTVRCSVQADGLHLSFDRVEGRFLPWWTKITVIVHGWGSGSVARGTRTIASQGIADVQTLTFTIPIQKAASEFMIKRDREK